MLKKTLKEKVKQLIRKSTPDSLRTWVYILKNRTYAEDGLMSVHIADFCKDRAFISAYQKGQATGSWNGSDLRWRVYIACWAAKRALSIPGDFVECGVNRGGMSLAAMEYIGFNATGKHFFLFDTYSGFPSHLLRAAASANIDDYSDCYTDVLKTFETYPGARVIRGEVPHSLKQVEIDRICYLSIDMNCAEPETAAVRFFWPKLVPGAILLLDDYAFSESYRRQKEAFDELSRELNFEILTLPTGQGLVIKT